MLYVTETTPIAPGQHIDVVLCKNFEYPFFVSGFFCMGQFSVAMDQNQSTNRTLKRQQVGGLPLIHAIVERMKLKDILYKYIPAHGNEDIPAVETLMLLVYNLILGKDPLYGKGVTH